MEPLFLVVWLMTHHGADFGSVREVVPRTQAECLMTISDPANAESVAASVKAATGVDVELSGLCKPVQP